MAERVSIVLDGPISFSSPGRPILHRDYILTTSDPDIIAWARSLSFCKVEVLDVRKKVVKSSEEKKDKLVTQKKKGKKSIKKGKRSNK